MEWKETAVAYNHLSGIREFLDYVDPLEHKYEFWDGAVVMMAGSTQGHALIRDNINDCFKTNLKNRGCISFQESVYLKMKNKDKTLFSPDVLVTCNSNDLDLKSRFVESPSIIVEILTESTERLDRGEKWAHYRKIPSLRYYIMVSQQQPLVEVYGRPHAHSLFYFEAFEGFETLVDLREFDLIIPMSQVYDGIDFEVMAELP